MELPHITMLVVVAIAAFTDTRSGIIPNWLTLPSILAGPVYFFFAPEQTALASLLAVFVVGLVPYIMYWMESLGGGDVKLFAGLGGLGGITLGLEILLYSMVAAAVIAMLTMAKNGHLRMVLSNVWRMLSNPFLPKAHRKPLQKGEMHQLRLGLSILVGTGAAMGYQYAAF